MSDKIQFSVLIIDDNPSSLKVISELLREEDCQVFSAKNGESGMCSRSILVMTHQ